MQLLIADGKDGGSEWGVRVMRLGLGLHAVKRNELTGYQK